MIDIDDLKRMVFLLEHAQQNGELSEVAAFNLPVYKMALRATELEADRDALANENLAIKAKIAIHAGGFSVCPVCSHEEPSETDDIVWMVNETPTPATDAYANQLRAEGVEMFAKHFNCPDISDDILEFAANLRKDNGND